MGELTKRLVRAMPLGLVLPALWWPVAQAAERVETERVLPPEWQIPGGTFHPRQRGRLGSSVAGDHDRHHHHRRAVRAGDHLVHVALPPAQGR